MGDVIIINNLHDFPTGLSSNTGHQFVVDCTRAAEGLLTYQDLQQKYELTPADWQSITKDEALGYNFRRLIRWLRILLRLILRALFPPTQTAADSSQTTV
jgi:hypothetical protein